MANDLQMFSNATSWEMNKFYIFYDLISIACDFVSKDQIDNKSNKSALLRLCAEPILTHFTDTYMCHRA